jgi:hypothetical protein
MSHCEQGRGELKNRGKKTGEESIYLCLGGRGRVGGVCEQEHTCNNQQCFTLFRPSSVPEATSFPDESENEADGESQDGQMRHDDDLCAASDAGYYPDRQACKRSIGTPSILWRAVAVAERQLEGRRRFLCC